MKKTGTSGADTMFGTTGSDELRGAGGNDHIEGNTGNDRLIGDSGNDYIVGHGYRQDLTLEPDYPAFWGIVRAQDNDTLGGGAGDDVLIDFWGNNRIDGGDGLDFIQGGAGKDTLIGGRGDDSMDGGPGSDLFIPGVGNDHMHDTNDMWNADEFLVVGGILGDPDPDIFLLERNLGPIGHDGIYNFDRGMDRIHIEDYTPCEVTVTEHGLAFADGSTLTMVTDPPGLPPLVAGIDFFFV